jgi:hypothetical protein
MPHIFKLSSQDMSRFHRQIGVESLKGLYSSHLIHANGPLSLFGPTARDRIKRTPFIDFLVALRIRNLR